MTSCFVLVKFCLLPSNWKAPLFVAEPQLSRKRSASDRNEGRSRDEPISRPNLTYCAADPKDVTGTLPINQARPGPFRQRNGGKGVCFALQREAAIRNPAHTCQLLDRIKPFRKKPIPHRRG